VLWRKNGYCVPFGIQRKVQTAEGKGWSESSDWKQLVFFRRKTKETGSELTELESRRDEHLPNPDGYGE